MEKIHIAELSNYTTQARGVKNNIILHWSGGRYDEVHESYHINVDGDGAVWFDGSLSDHRNHAWNRNGQAIGVSICAMYGAVVGKDGNIITRGNFPYSQHQLDIMAKVTAKIALEVGIPLYKIRTHSEIAELDGYGIKSNDPQMRWDLINQGDDLRQRVAGYMEEFKKQWKN